MQIIADPRAGTDAAKAKTVDGFDTHAIPSGSDRHRHNPLYTARLTGLRSAQLDHGARILFGAEIMIETDDAADFCPAEIQGVGNAEDYLSGYMAEFGMHVVQNGQQRIVPTGMRRYDVVERSVHGFVPKGPAGAICRPVFFPAYKRDISVKTLDGEHLRTGET